MTAKMLVLVLILAAMTLAQAQGNSFAPGKHFQARAAVVSSPQTGVIFAKPVSYSPGGTDLGGIALADVNGDGKLDTIVVSNSENSVGVMLGSSGGALGSVAKYDSGGLNPVAVAVGDVNGDGKPDILVTNQCMDAACAFSSVAVLLGNGNGTFHAAMPMGAGGLYARSVVLGDVNGDHKTDLLVLNSCVSSTNCANGTIGVFQGNGNGTFQALAPIVINPVSGTSFLAATDLNGDGKLDLLLARECTSNIGNCTGAVDVLLGQGNGTFTAPVSYSSSSPHVRSLAVADVNGDGKQDVLLAEQLAGRTIGAVAVLLGKGDGTLGAAQLFQVAGGGGATYVSAADVNGDGTLDLIALSCNQSQCPTKPRVFVLLGHGDGTFQPAAPVAYDTGGAPFFRSAAAGDVNGDGKPDLVVANTTFQPVASTSVTVLLNIFKTKTTTIAASNLNPAAVGQTVKLTATVAGLYAGKTTGSVTFQQNGALLGTANVVAGSASINHVFPKNGTFPIVAKFVGDGNSKASVAATLSQVVTP